MRTKKLLNVVKAWWYLLDRVTNFDERSAAEKNKFIIGLKTVCRRSQVLLIPTSDSCEIKCLIMRKNGDGNYSEKNYQKELASYYVTI